MMFTPEPISQNLNLTVKSWSKQKVGL